MSNHKVAHQSYHAESSADEAQTRRILANFLVNLIMNFRNIKFITPDPTSVSPHGTHHALTNTIDAGADGTRPFVI
jgi:hypothetical protein